MLTIDSRHYKHYQAIITRVRCYLIRLSEYA